jgi:hypothetical protein
MMKCIVANMYHRHRFLTERNILLMSVPLKWADSVPIPVLTAKAYRSRGGIGPLVLELDTRRT